MKTAGPVVVLLVAVTFLSGCANMGFNRRDAGTVGGAVVGGIAGNAISGGSTFGTVAGAAGGAYLGNQLAK